MITAFFRTVLLYILIVVGMRLMGKRQIGELEPSELVLTMMISDLASVPMQDFGIPLLAGFIPILTLLALSLFLSQLSLHNLRFRKLMCGSPTILIRNGEIQQSAMRKNRLTLDELLEELREQGYSDLQDIKYAILENSGQLSVFPWTAQQPPTVEQLGLKIQDDVTLPVVLINDGRVLQKNLCFRFPLGKCAGLKEFLIGQVMLVTFLVILGKILVADGNRRGKSGTEQREKE